MARVEGPAVCAYRMNLTLPELLLGPDEVAGTAEATDVVVSIWAAQAQRHDVVGDRGGND